MIHFRIRSGRDILTLICKKCWSLFSLYFLDITDQSTTLITISFIDHGIVIVWQTMTYVLHDFIQVPLHLHDIFIIIINTRIIITFILDVHDHHLPPL